MKELLEYIVGNIVDDKSAVNVTVTEKDEDKVDVVIELRVAPEDMGKVIGKQGKIILSIRTLVKAIGMRDGKRYDVEILGGEKKRRSAE